MLCAENTKICPLGSYYKKIIVVPRVVLFTVGSVPVEGTEQRVTVVLVMQMREIDRGSFGKIFKSTYEGRTVAVKQLANQGPSTLKAKMRELLLELRVLVRIEHPNIVKFYGTATDFNKAQSQNKQPYVGKHLYFTTIEPQLCCNASLNVSHMPLV